MTLIGTPHNRDPWTVATHLTDARKADFDEFRRLDIPEEWFDSCSTDGVFPILSVGGQDPQRTLSELVKASELGLGLHLALPSGFDLRVLASAIGNAPFLGIHSDGKLYGWDVLREARQTRRLSVSGVSEQLPVEDLPRLTSLIGTGANTESAVRNPHLTRIDLAIPSWPADLIIEGPVEHLELSSEIQRSKRINRLPQLRRPKSLRQFRLRFADAFDVATILDATHLETLDISNCSKIVNVGALAQMKHLRRVAFFGVRSMPGWQDLEDLSCEELIIEKNSVIPTAFGDRLTRANATWYIAPKRASGDDKIRAEFRFTEESEDATTFAPFIVVDDSDEAGIFHVHLDRTENPGFLPELSTADLEERIREAIRISSSDALTHGEATVRSDDDSSVDLTFISLTLIAKVLSQLMS